MEINSANNSAKISSQSHVDDSTIQQKKDALNSIFSLDEWGSDVNGIDTQKEFDALKTFSIQLESWYNRFKSQFSSTQKLEVDNMFKEVGEALKEYTMKNQKPGTPEYYRSLEYGDLFEERIMSPMVELADSACRYIEEHNSIEGFVFSGLPLEVTDVNVEIIEHNFDSQNDTFSIKEGKSLIERNADSRRVLVKFKVDNKEYSTYSDYSTELSW